MKSTPSQFRPRGLFAIAAFVLPPARVGAAAATGTIEGRVLDVTTGAYLGNARVSVEGAALQAFTNNLGEYRLSGVPAGPATVQVFFTGLFESYGPNTPAYARRTERDDYGVAISVGVKGSF